MQKVCPIADLQAAEAFDDWQGVTRSNISRNEIQRFDGPRWSGELQITDESALWLQPATAF